MWIISAAISVVLCIGSWILMAKENRKSVLLSAGSIAFVAITLLIQYKMVSDWVRKEDWTAMLDVIPSMFVILAIYVIALILTNVVTIAKVNKK